MSADELFPAEVVAMDSPRLVPSSHFKSIIPIGSVYGRWTVVSKPVKSTDKRVCRAYVCKCTCGIERLVRGSRLTAGASKSCGCFIVDRARLPRPAMRTHGFGKTRFFFIWRDMIRRCEDPRHPSFPDYGAKGITVCEQWHDIKTFAADMGLPADNLTIDRIDNAVGYQPGNCRWATRRQQQENRRCTRWIFINGARITIAEASRRFGVKYSTITRRIKSGWAHDRAVTKPKVGIPLWNEGSP